MMRRLRGTQAACASEYTEEKELMDAVNVDVGLVMALWTESCEAEREGRITRALELHEQVLSCIGISYAACLRAGRLHYRVGGYQRSLSFYVKALLLSPGESAPWYGMVLCYVAQGDTESAAGALRAAEELNLSPPRGFSIDSLTPEEEEPLKCAAGAV
jgi:tetratricopeptide (TPR) repeat protein